ncbi:MAG: hypothetical protein CV087_21545 [Candidatus Brocadia sp. WS118]|nr:MAG: hypothetical protein CV087_21545 [Candidatus Brocadia sp. WS118]
MGKKTIPASIKQLLVPGYSWMRTKIFRYLFRDYSQAGETIAVRKALKEWPNKVFVEIGANDGVTVSTTLGLLEEGWTGWSIEANPAIHKKLKQNLERFHQAKTFNIAIAPKKGKVKLWLGKNDPLGLYSTLSTEENDWFKKHRGDQYVEVEGMPLSEFLNQENVPNRFGLLLVDTEGMDLEILRTLDPEKHKPKLIVTEDYAPKNDEKFKLLESYGYKFWRRIGCNTFWLSNQ